MQSTCPTISSFNWILCDANVKRIKRFQARTVPVRFILTWLQFYNECKCTLIGFWMSQRAFKHAGTESRKRYSRLPHTASYTCIKFQHEFPFGIGGSNYNWFKFRIRAFRQQYITNSPFSSHLWSSMGINKGSCGSTGKRWMMKRNTDVFSLILITHFLIPINPFWKHVLAIKMIPILYRRIPPAHHSRRRHVIAI